MANITSYPPISQLKSGDILVVSDTSTTNNATKTTTVGAIATLLNLGPVTGVTGTAPILSSGGNAPDISIDDYTGSDGITAGTKGSVPAPAIADNVKFLKGDGTWAPLPINTISANGTFENFGASGGGADILGGSSVDFGVPQNTAADQFPFYIIPTAGGGTIKAIGIQWGSNVDYQTARGSSTVTFNVSAAKLGTDVTDVNSWLLVGTLTTVLDGTSGSYPGFLEQVDFPLDRELIQVTAVASSGFANTGEEMEISILIG